MVRLGKLFVLLLILIVVVCIVAVSVLPMFSINHISSELKSLYTNHLSVLADKAAVFIRRSDLPSLRNLLERYTTDGSTLEYAFVQSGGRPYVHTFSGGFPNALLDLHEEITTEPSISEITLQDSGRIYDISMLIGLGSASLHIGVKASSIDSFSWLSTALPFSVLGLGLLIIAGFAVVVAIRFAQKVKVPKPQPKTRPVPKVEGEQKQEPQWADVVESIPAGVLVVEPVHDRIIIANRAAMSMIGLPKGTIQGATLDSFFRSTESKDLPLTEIVDDPISRRGFLITTDNDAVPVARFHATVEIDGLEHLLITFFDISDLKQLEDRFRQAYTQQESLANYDNLTRLFNRHAIKKHAEAELNRAERGAPLSLVLLDIDHFKKINDEHGHNAGDIVLKRLAHVVRNSVRPYDWLGRWGGEEFMIILPGTPLLGAAVVCDRIRSSIEENSVHLKGFLEIKVTISLGITSTGSDGGNSHILETLVQQADEALYLAKEKGRNRIGLYRRGELSIFNPKKDVAE